MSAGKPGAKIRVRISEYKLGRAGEVLACYGLGSCVGVAILDKVANIGAMAHILLPANQGIDDNPLKYADTCIEAMVEELVLKGADPEGLTAKIAGGADMFQHAPFDGNEESIGSKNISAVRKKLLRLEIKLEKEDIGGHHGRTIEFDISTGTMLIRQASGVDKTI